MKGVQFVIQRIADDLHACGIHQNSTVLVHSSLRALGMVPGGAETVIQGFLRAIGEGGTLLMPALSYASVTMSNPVFDQRRTPSCVGMLTEYFRTRPGTLRSLHPTHSVCGVGPLASKLLAAHQRDTTPCGAHSPFRRLCDVGGIICFLGCGLRPNTSMHGVEEIVEPPYLFQQAVKYRVISTDGPELSLTCRRHNFAGYAQRYERLADILKSSELWTGHCLGAMLHLVDAAPMWEKATTILQYDPYYFVEPETHAS